jgi:hypothetical protein
MSFRPGIEIGCQFSDIFNARMAWRPRRGRFLLPRVFLVKSGTAKNPQAGPLTRAMHILFDAYFEGAVSA